MTIYKTAITVEGTSEFSLCDTIQHRDELWLVPAWVQFREPELAQPERIVRLSQSRFRPADEWVGPGNFLISEPIPKAVLFGEDPPSMNGQYVAQLTPDIFFKVSEVGLQ